MIICICVLHGQINVTGDGPQDINVPADELPQTGVNKIVIEFDATDTFGISELRIEACVEYVGGYYCMVIKQVNHIAIWIHSMTIPLIMPKSVGMSSIGCHRKGIIISEN